MNPKAAVVARVLLVVGILYHTRSVPFTAAVEQEVAHHVGAVFDAAAVAVVLLRRKGPPPGDRQPVGNWVPLVVLLFGAVAVMNVGCSQTFREGTAAVSRPLVLNATSYVNGDASLDASGRSVRQAEVAAYDNATRDAAIVDLETVAAAWGYLRAWYVPYLDADPRATPASARGKVRRLTVEAQDLLIAAERERLAAWGLIGDGEVRKAAEHATPPPATQPAR